MASWLWVMQAVLMVIFLQDTLVAVSGKALAAAVVLVAVLQIARLSDLEGTLVAILEEVVAVLAIAQLSVCPWTAMAVWQTARLSDLEGTLVAMLKEVVAVLAIARLSVWQCTAVALRQEVAFLGACAVARRLLVPEVVRQAEAAECFLEFALAWNALPQ